MADGESVVVIVRFRPGLGVPYEDGIEGRLPALLGPRWRALADDFPDIAFQRVFADPPAGKGKIAAHPAAEDELEYFFQVEFADEKLAHRFVERLKVLRGDLVEDVYLEGQATAPGLPIGIDHERRSVSENQGYFGRAPRGIDVASAWRRFGAFGAGVSVADVETGWDFDHPDLPRGLQQICGLNHHQPDHGTSDLGILVALRDSPRVSGGAPEARVVPASYVQSEKLKSSVGWAIDQANLALNPGDILLLEAVWPLADEPGRSAWAEAPAEVKAHVRTAINRCARRDILVIEPAGNEGRDLAPLRLDENRSDALMVAGAFHDDGGASHWAVRKDAMSFNYGTRVDCFAWGHDIATLREAPALYWDFKGSSGAAAIIAVAAALLQSLARRKLATLRPAKPYLPIAELRKYLTNPDDGTLSEDRNSCPIGVMPDLNRAFARFLQDIGEPVRPSQHAQPAKLARPATPAQPAIPAQRAIPAQPTIPAHREKPVKRMTAAQRAAQKKR